MDDTKAVFYEGEGKVTARPHEADGAPGADQVQVRVAFNGICGTDLHIFHGTMDERVGPPAILGHEMAGTIEAVGADVGGWAVGDKVTVMPLEWCESCPACHAGHRHICHNLDFIGIDAPGALQDVWNVRVDHLVRLPDDLDLSIGALAEPLAVAIHDIRRGSVTAGDLVVVIGGGPIGVLIGLVATSLDARVLLSEPDDGRRQLAATLGLDAVDPVATDLAAHVHALTDGAGADVAFEVSGSRPGAAALTSVLKTRGTAVVVGIHTEPPPIDLFQVFWRELEIRGARVYERTDFEAAVELLDSDELPLVELISDIVPAADAQRAFETLDAGGAIMKLLIDCQDFGTA